MRRDRAPLDEGTARFIFQGAIGVGIFCVLATLLLGMQESYIGAWIFLVLALISIGVLFYYGRIYIALRRQRWRKELERPNEALEQLFIRARREQEPRDPPTPPEGPDRA